MVDLFLKYANGTTEVAQYGLTFFEACELGQWYVTHCESGRPTTVVTYFVKPAPKH